MSSRFHDKRISFCILIGKNRKALYGRCGKRPVWRAFPNENKKLVHSHGRLGLVFRMSLEAAGDSFFTGKPTVPGFSPPTSHKGKSCRQKKQKNFTKALAVFFRSEYITATDAADMIRSADGRLAQLVERLVYTEDVGSSSLSSPTIIAEIAQLVEQLTCNQ